MDAVKNFGVEVFGTWTVEKNRKVRNKLLVHFQSRNRSGGGECFVEMEEPDRRAPRAFVYFTQQDVRDRVLAKTNHEIVVDGQTIQLRLRLATNVADGRPDEAPPPRSAYSKTPKNEDEATAATGTDSELGSTTAVLLENVAVAVSPDLLVVLVESVSGSDKDGFRLEMAWESSSVVVTFVHAADAEKFLAASRTSSKLQNYGLTARALGAPTSIRMEELPPTAIRDLLYLYFDKNWGEMGDVTLIPEEEAAVVTFSHPRVVRNICQEKEHVLGSIRVKVYPYYESLGTALYGPDRSVWKMPEPFVEAVHPAVLRFLLAKNLLKNLNDQMRLHFCCVDLESAEVKLRPLPSFLRQKNLTGDRVDSWVPSAQDAFRRIMSEYSAFECPASAAAWNQAEKVVRSVVKEDAVLVFDASKAVLVVAGRSEDIKKMKPSVENVILKAASDFERQTRTIVEVMKMSPAWFYMLTQGGLQKAAANISTQMNLTHNKDEQSLRITGLPEEVYKTTAWIHERNGKMSKKTLDVTPGILSFLSKTDLSQELFTSQGISAVYTVDNKGLSLSGTSDQILANAERKMTSALSLQTLTVEDWRVVNLPTWTHLIRQLLDKYNPANRKTVEVQVQPESKVMVVGLVKPVEEVRRGLTEFIRNFSQVQEKLCLETCAVVRFVEKMKNSEWSRIAKDNEVSVAFDPVRSMIVLDGAHLHVQKAKSSLVELTDTFSTGTLVVDKPGAKKYIQAQGSIYLSNIMSELGCVVELRPDKDQAESDQDETSSIYCRVQTASGVMVSVSKANICRFSADAVVNAANEGLKHEGGLAMALVKAAGPQLQKASKDLVAKRGNLGPGEAVVTDAFNLPCKWVIHTVGPRFAKHDKKAAVSLLETAVLESLKQAEKIGCSSIALPAISAGTFGFPIDLCGETIAKAVREFCHFPRDQQSLTEIHLVDNNDSTVKVLATAVNQMFNDFGPILTIPQGAAGRGAGPSRSEQGQHKDGSPKASYRGPQVSEQGGAGESGAGSHGNGEAKSHSRNTSQNESEGQRGPSRVEQTTAEGLRIVLRKGNIQDQMTDVIVNTISEDLDLNSGAVSKALLKAAGSVLQSDIRLEAAASTVRCGSVVTTGGGNLNCSKVLHAVCPHWVNGRRREEEDLSSIIRFCLQQTEKLRLASLSFPAIGTGTLRFPRELVCRLLLSEVHSFSRAAKPRYLQEVALVVHPSDGQTVDCFFREFQRHAALANDQQEATHPTRPAAPQAESQSQQASASSSQVSSPSHGVYRMQLRQLTLEVSPGDITKETSDVIINSSNEDFNLKTGVSKAILDGAGWTVPRECSRIVGSPNYQQRGMILTSGGQLPCRNIIHVVGQKSPTLIKEIVSSVLIFSEANGFSSVSFPALGTGQGGADPSAVADAMVDGVVEFVKKKQPQSVRSVKILVFQTAMMAEFQRSMKKHQGEEADWRSIFTKLKDSVTSVFSRHSNKQHDAPASLILETKEFEPTVFELCADNDQVISAAKSKILKMIVDAHAHRTISDPCLSRLSQEDLDQLKALQVNLTVCIRLETEQEDQEPKVHLEGLTTDVQTAETDIREMIRKLERTENQRKNAQLTSELVEWRFQDSSGTTVPFDILTNYHLEEALASQETVKIQINKIKFNADPTLKKAFSVSGKHEPVELLRRDLKGCAPPHWANMQDQLVKVFSVTKGSPEFNEVQQKMTQTGLTASIVSVERVQNATLWQNYQLKKKELETKNQHANNERLLFHGTSRACVDHINTKGFNRSYAGTHGAMYGNGSYFAVDPVYSAKGYAKPDASGLRRMYQARVLVGDYCKGRTGMITPPAKSGNAVDLYDSVVDRISNPTIFVVFHDIQAYPEYLITFT